MIYSVIGFVLFTTLMVVAHKRKMSQTLYIPFCLAAATSGATLLVGVYGYYYGVVNLYYYIVTTLVVGLIIDFIIRKTVSQKD